MYFPITIVDNFYNDFNKIKNFALSQIFYKKTNFNMPGVETKALHEINSIYFKNCVEKLLLLFYSRIEMRNILYNCQTKFEKIIPYGVGYNKEGWIHSDDSNKLSAIFYVSGEYDEGTSFYKNKNITPPNYSLLNYKNRLFSGEQIDINEYNDALKKHNNQFEEILKVPFVENRLVIFDSSIFHRADGYGSLEKPRIIQTFFYRSILADNFPLPEIKRYPL